jgi:putative acetyltransferase
MNNSICIREVQVSDNFALATMIRGVFDEHNAPKFGTVYTDPTTDNLYQLFQTPESILWVLEIDKTPVGCCGIYPTQGLDENCAELVKFYIGNKARGKGFGKLLMEKCIQSAIDLGFKSIYLESMPEFAKAVRIYEKLGFKSLPKAMGCSGHTGCNIWMIKDL